MGNKNDNKPNPEEPVPFLSGGSIIEQNNNYVLLTTDCICGNSY